MIGPGPGGRRRHGVRQLRVRRVRRPSGQRVAGVRSAVRSHVMLVRLQPDLEYASMRLQLAASSGSPRRSRSSPSAMRRPQTPRAAAPTDAPTFTRDVAPIMFAKCASCHRPGEVAPMSLLTYSDARPWAGAIRRRSARARCRRGTPIRQHGTFRNDLQPDATARSTRSSRWVGRRRARRRSGGAAAAAEVPRGLADRHARRRVRDAGRTSRFRPQARSTTSISRCRRISPKTSGCRPAKCAPAIARTCITSSSTCASRSATARPNVVTVRPIPSRAGGRAAAARRAAADGPAAAARAAGAQRATAARRRRRDARELGGRRGRAGARAGTAKRIPAGSTLIFQVHYTTNGTPGTRPLEDRTDLREGAAAARGPHRARSPTPSSRFRPAPATTRSKPRRRSPRT